MASSSSIECSPDNAVGWTGSYPQIKHYGLLHIDRIRNVDANFNRFFRDPIDVYIGCAAMLARSATANAIDFTLLTNDAVLVSNRFAELQLGDVKICIKQLEYSRSIPSVKIFYSAHHKLDVIRALGTGRYGKFVSLVDLDTVFFRSLPRDAFTPEKWHLSAYDVSQPVFAVYGKEQCQRDLELVAGEGLTEPKWYGGEVLVGSSDSMQSVSDLIEDCWLRYITNIRHVHHIGDEMVVSAALNLLVKRSFEVRDLGKLGEVARWWSLHTKVPQVPFDALQDRALLHLPADKIFLSRQAKEQYSREHFSKHFRAYARRKLMVRQLLLPMTRWSLPRLE